MISKEAWYKEALQEAEMARLFHTDPQGYVRALVRSGRPIGEYFERVREQARAAGEDDWEPYKQAQKQLIQWARKGLLKGANLEGFSAYAEDMRGVQFQGVRGGRMDKCNLDGASFENADLSGAYLSQSSFQGANFQGANLSGAKITRADLRFAKFDGANLEGADLRGANYDKEQLEGTTGTPIGSPPSRWDEADLEDFFRGYVGAALWLVPEWSEDEVEHGNEEPWDTDQFDEDDILPEAMASMREDCISFLGQAFPMLPDNLNMAGYHFFLTRNRHGTGFWDQPERYGEYADDLTELADLYGNQQLWPGQREIDGETSWVLFLV